MPLFKPEKQKETKTEELLDAIKNNLNPKKEKPTKFTWKGLAQFISMGDPTIPISSKMQRIKDLSNENAKAIERDYTDFFEDIEKGVYKGAEKFAYALGDLATTGIDLVAGTNLNTKIEEVFEQNPVADPETILGKTSEVLTQFGLPGGVSFKILDRVGKLAKLRTGKAFLTKTFGKKTSNIATKAGYMATGIAATDFLASDPDRETLFFKKENVEGLTERERAAAQFRNRIKFGQEGALIGSVFSLAGKPIALGFKYGLFKPTVGAAKIGFKAIDKIVVEPASYLLSKDKYIIPTISKKLQNASQYTLEKVIAPTLIGRMPIKTQLPEFSQWRMFSANADDPLKRRLKKLDNVLSYFRSVGEQTGTAFQLSSRGAREIKAQARTIEKYLEDIEAKSYNLARGFKDLYNTNKTSPASKEHYLGQVLSFFKKELDLNQLPKQLQEPAKLLDKELLRIKGKFADLLPEGELKKYMLDNVNSYMRKSFSIFTNPEYRPDEKILNAGVNWFKQLIVNNRDLRTTALGSYPNLKGQPEKQIEEYAKVLTNKLLRDGRIDDKDPLAVLQHLAKRNLRMDKQIRTGEELPDVIKRLLGEEDNLKASVLTTTSHAITQTVNKILADRLATLGVKEGWIFKNEAQAVAAGITDAQKIIPSQSLGLLNTRLFGKYASAQVAQAIRGAPGKLDNAIQNGAYRAILQFKVATQFGKTVLSPATQVRNVTSASLFPLASGHIGGRASVTESFKMVMDDIFGAGKEVNTEKLIKSIEDKIRLGVLDENIVASELGAVLKEIKKGSVNSLDGLYNKLSNGQFMRTATRIYAGGDNLWKWYGHEYVKSQLRGLFNNLDDVAKWTKEITGRDYLKRDLMSNKIKNLDEAIDEAAAWYIRNTYPTYSKVPEVIRDIRKLPFGNFVSFPAEMIRTSFNLVNIAAKEISSSNPVLRQIGYRRMMGTAFTIGGASKGALGIATALTGTTIDEIDAYKRSFAASWNKDSVLIPMDKWKEGKGKAINFSYFSPYEVVQKPIESFMRELQQGKMKNQDIDDRTLTLFGEFIGPLIQPFFSEAIALEKVFDVMPAGVGVGGRGGMTKSGSRVYSQTDEISDKMIKSFSHIVKGVQPGAYTTGKKIFQGINEDLNRGGTPVNLRDELLALFSGIRIINVDIPRAYDYKITEYNKNKRSVTSAEKFYTTENIQTRGGKVLEDEFRKIQDEYFKVQQDFYNVLQDALDAGVSKRELRKRNKKRLSNREFNTILRGKFTPFEPSRDRMMKRYKNAKEAFPDKDIDKNFVYPRQGFNDIIREYKNKELKRALPVEEPMIEEPTQQEQVQPQFQSKLNVPIQTPPLPQTPQPSAVAQVNTNVINPLSGLTRTQQALLSPSEQALVQRKI
jgi:hypothetical protein